MIMIRLKKAAIIIINNIRFPSIYLIAIVPAASMALSLILNLNPTINQKATIIIVITILSCHIFLVVVVVMKTLAVLIVLAMILIRKTINLKAAFIVVVILSFLIFLITVVVMEREAIVNILTRTKMIKLTTIIIVITTTTTTTKRCPIFLITIVVMKTKLIVIVVVMVITALVNVVIIITTRNCPKFRTMKAMALTLAQLTLLCKGDHATLSKVRNSIKFTTRLSTNEQYARRQTLVM